MNELSTFSFLWKMDFFILLCIKVHRRGFNREHMIHGS